MTSAGRAPRRSSDVRAGYEALNAFFDRAYVITLRRAARRQAQLARALDGLRYELVYGRDGQELELAALIAEGIYDPDRARRLDRYGRAMTGGQVACVLSHMDVWRRIGAGSHRRALILEDDAVPCPEGLARVEEALAELPESWDLLYLGYDRNERVTVRRRVDRLAYMALGALRLHYLSAREASNLLPRPFGRRLRRAGLHDLTHAYAITPRAARRLLAFQEPIALTVDTGLTRLTLRGELEAYVADPKAFRQSGLDSFIRRGDGGGG